MGIEEYIGKDLNGRPVKCWYERKGETVQKRPFELKMCYYKAVREKHIENDVIRKLTNHHNLECDNCDGWQNGKACYSE